MGVPIVVDKTADTPDHCVYAFGAPETTVGRVRLAKASGDVELLTLSDNGDGPSEQFYLAHLVPRLQDYHDRATYPAHDRWEA